MAANLSGFCMDSGESDVSFLYRRATALSTELSPEAFLPDFKLLFKYSGYKTLELFFCKHLFRLEDQIFLL